MTIGINIEIRCVDRTRITGSSTQFQNYTIETHSPTSMAEAVVGELLTARLKVKTYSQTYGSVEAASLAASAMNGKINTVYDLKPYGVIDLLLAGYHNHTP